MNAFPSQAKALTDYITARIELDFDAERRAIRISDADPQTAASWAWVRQGQQRRTAVKQLVKILNSKCGDGTEPALMWLATLWASDAPLVDRRGLPYTANEGGLTYLTECHLATPTFSGSTLCCRVCYEQVDDVLLLPPEVSSVDTPWRGDTPEATTTELLRRVEDAGRQAYTAGRPAAPSADPLVRDLIKDMPVGGGAIEIFEAFTRGRDAAADEAAAKLLADD